LQIDIAIPTQHQPINNILEEEKHQLETYLHTSSSGLGGGGGNVDLSILRSCAFFLPAFDLAFFPMVILLFYMQVVVVWLLMPQSSV